MSSLSTAPIQLTMEERAELEGLARSTKTEHRTRLTARIVLMAAEGAATRAFIADYNQTVRPFVCQANLHSASACSS